MGVRTCGDGGQLGPGVDLLAEAHPRVHLQQRLLPCHRPGDQVQVAHDHLIVIAHFLQVQWADVIISKTRMLSIFQQGMTNWVLNFGLVFETACAAFLLYFPYSYFIGFYPIAPEWWIPALPFSLLIWVSKNFPQI